MLITPVPGANQRIILLPILASVHEKITNLRSGGPAVGTASERAYAYLDWCTESLIAGFDNVHYVK
ncbi:hypothetical protein FXF53_25915 [Micromonospora sp. WP24]|uniref:hypothetical protein n=1 Tax=Micromonospora sp. WP24 TaxID=2604469 RepID=UPI0011DA254B|nr:hypothetical protein [Micromonospora sp. WP24]TYB95043.1 hypothetical protein FXF53_25915 [Micromonospora sp. WP24]